MNDDNASKHNAAERAVALAKESLDLLREAQNAPASPVTAFMNATQRRALRREATRLRQGKTEPRYGNLHSAEDLADIYERTAVRDEMFEQYAKGAKRTAREMERLLEEHPSEIDEAMVAFARETQRVAEEQGPGSEAARRFDNMLFLASVGYQRHAHRRRQKTSAPRRVQLADPSIEARYALSAAELVTSPPSPEEAVIAFPPKGKDS
jgi:hypothetical protein